MDKNGFLVIFDRRYFLFMGILIVLIYGYSYFDEQGYILEGSATYDIGDFFGLQPPNMTLIEANIFMLTNEQRINYGLPPLIWDEELAFIAREHSKDMYERNFFDHDNPYGDGPTERAEKRGIRIVSGGWIGIAENIGETPIGDVIGCGYTYDEEDISKCAVDGWMGSLGHRENILGNNYDVVGIGTYCTDSTCFNTQNFR